MKREWATFGVMVLFGLSLAGTSKNKADGSGTSSSSSASAVSPPSSGSAAASTVTTHLMTLPDTSTWKSFVSAPTKLTAKTPPGTQVSCTKTGTITVCTLTKGMMIAAFGHGGRSEQEIARDLKKPKPGTTTILYETPDALVVHRSDPDIGEYCEYVTTSEPKLLSVNARVEGVDPAAFKTIAPKDQDCLDVVAFATTLKSTP